MSSALVLLSGGQDSTTCLAWAKSKFEKVFALTIDYGQRHLIEINQAKVIAKLATVDHEILTTDIFSKMSKNALTHEDVMIDAGGGDQLPSTFVPGRNLVFLSLAAIKAYQLDLRDIVMGVCQTDYSGYPDCHDDFVRSLEKTASLAMDTSFTIHTPLMWLTKGQTVELIRDLGKLDWLKESHTCYEGLRPACGKCPSCVLRLKGFAEARIEDPLEYI